MATIFEIKANLVKRLHPNKLNFAK